MFARPQLLDKALLLLSVNQPSAHGSAAVTGLIIIYNTSQGLGAYFMDG